MGAFGAVTFAFVEAGDFLEINLVRGFDVLQHRSHASIKVFGKEDLVIAPTVHDEGRDMPRHGRPVDVRLHRFFPADGVAGEQKKAAEAGDLVKLLLAVLAAHVDAVFLNEERHEVATIAFAVPLDAADLVKERRQDPGIGVAHASEGIDLLPLHRLFDFGLARLDRPFVHATHGVVDIADKKRSVVGIEHDLPDGRTGAFRHDPVHHAFAFCHPCSGETHDLPPLASPLRHDLLQQGGKKQRNCGFSMSDGAL